MPLYPSDLPIREILREASVALDGATVTLWVIDGDGRAVELVSSEDHVVDPSTGREVLAILEEWGITVSERSRWVSARIDEAGRWCVGRVRPYPPQPPPEGRERRGRNRMILELAGLCIGLLERAEHEQEVGLA